MIVSHFPHGPTVFFTLHNVSLRHDIASYKESTVSEQYPHLIFENFSSRLGERVRDATREGIFRSSVSAGDLEYREASCGPRGLAARAGVVVVRTVCETDVPGGEDGGVEMKGG